MNINKLQRGSSFTSGIIFLLQRAKKLESKALKSLYNKISGGCVIVSHMVFCLFIQAVLLRYNFYTIQTTHCKQFIFSKIQLCHHHHDPILEHFHHLPSPESSLVPICSHSFFHTQATTDLRFCVALMYVSLMTSQVENFFTWLLALWISSFVKFLSNVLPVSTLRYLSFSYSFVGVLHIFCAEYFDR